MIKSMTYSSANNLNLSFLSKKVLNNRLKSKDLALLKQFKPKLL